MTTALIGHTGFVGSNIAAAAPFDELYNTANIADIRGRDLDLLVTAAARADSHRINQDGAADRAEIDAYADLLATVRARTVVLISTVCVYPGDTTPDEDAELTEDGLTPYGRNRLHLERRLAEQFEDVRPVRLAQLYGAGMKKGIVYDLLHDHRVAHIRPQGRFQYYDLGRLWSDIQVLLEHGLPSLNVATPPLTSARVAAECFGRDIADNEPPGEESPFAAMYTRDMRTRHDALFGGADGYLVTEQQEIAALRAFVARRRDGA